MLKSDAFDYAGDVDTVASIAPAAAAHCPALHQDLPKILRATLEDGRYGHRYIEAVDVQLLQHVRRHSP